MSFAFLKGHGTQNDFVLLPDLDGTRHDDLSADVVRALCDRRAGVGADGVLRVVRGGIDGGPAWFMDYRNADGSVAEMCGNGIRVFARYLAREGLVDRSVPLRIDTRDGVKTVEFLAGGEISTDMGVPHVGGPVGVTAAGRRWTGALVDMGNPHAVVRVESLSDAGGLLDEPGYDRVAHPSGLNVEFVVVTAPDHIALRVYERGVGETRSCGTGACAAVVGIQHGATRTTSPVRVDVPGGRLTVTWAESGRIHLQGPAEIVAEGTWFG